MDQEQAMQVAADQAAYNQLKDMYADATTIIGLIAERLCISVEPHQSFNDRLLEAATRAGREPWTKGSHMIDLERGRQIVQEGYDDKHDDEHDKGEIAMLGICYAIYATFGNGFVLECADRIVRDLLPDDWRVKSGGDRIRQLIKAGALMGAEADRLDRLAQATPVFACGTPPPPIEFERVAGQTRYHTVGKDGSKIDITDEITAIIERHHRGNT
jgi:hypothetical protein